MELLLFLVIGIVWTIAQALMKSKQPQPDGRDMRQPTMTHPRPVVKARQPVFEPKSEEDTVYHETLHIAPPLEVAEVTSDEVPVISDYDLVRGIVMAEVLGAPRSRKPHTYRGLKSRRP